MLRASGAVHRLGSDRTEGQARQGRHDSAKILVLSFASTDLRWGNDSVDEEITAMISAEISKDSRFKVTSRTQGSAWKDLNRVGRRSRLRTSARSRGRLRRDARGHRLRRAGTQDPFLLQGRAKASIKVPRRQKGPGVYRDIYTREFPSTGRSRRATSPRRTASRSSS